VESLGADLRDLVAVDLGDIDDPDGEAGEMRTRQVLANWQGRLLVALGGDNSITYAVARGMSATGVVTLDAHHDVRNGMSNGSPVARLVESGMDGQSIVQIGISDFANSREYAARAREYGITIISREEVAGGGMASAMAQALEIAGRGEAPRVHVDLDVDVCDRAVAPACPASVPGGLSAYELRQAARVAGADGRVVSLDLAEVDVSADTSDQRTVRLMALCVLEAAAGLLQRG
jgi:formiminoglutamase